MCLLQATGGAAGSWAAATVRYLQPGLLLRHLQPASGKVGPHSVAGGEGRGGEEEKSRAARVRTGGREGGSRVYLSHG